MIYSFRMPMPHSIALLSLSLLLAFYCGCQNEEVGPATVTAPPVNVEVAGQQGEETTGEKPDVKKPDVNKPTEQPGNLKKPGETGIPPTFSQKVIFTPVAKDLVKPVYISPDIFNKQKKGETGAARKQKQPIKAAPVKEEAQAQPQKGLQSFPAPGEGALFLFARDKEGYLVNWYWTSEEDSGWGSDGHRMRIGNTKLASDPVAVFNSARGKVEVFARTYEDTLWHAYWDSKGDGWGSDGHAGLFTYLNMAGDPAIQYSSMDNAVSLFARGSNGKLVLLCLDSKKNSGWEIFYYDIPVEGNLFGESVLPDGAIVFSKSNTDSIFAYETVPGALTIYKSPPLPIAASADVPAVVSPPARPDEDWVFSSDKDGIIRAYTYKYLISDSGIPISKKLFSIPPDITLNGMKELRAVSDLHDGSTRIFGLDQSSRVVEIVRASDGHWVNNGKPTVIGNEEYSELAAVYNSQNRIMEVFAKQSSEDIIRHWYRTTDGKWHQDFEPWKNQTISGGLVAVAIPTEHLTPMFGSTGGGPFNEACPPGAFANGLALRVGSDIDAIGLICKRPFDSASETITALHGGNGGGYIEGRCPSVGGKEGYLIGATGCGYDTDDSDWDIDYLGTLTMKCGLFSDGQHEIFPQEIAFATFGDACGYSSWWTSGEPTYTWAIPPNALITGIYGASGNRVDRISFVYKIIAP